MFTFFDNWLYKSGSLGTWGPACFTAIWLTAIADENVLLQYYISVKVEVSLPGRDF